MRPKQLWSASSSRESGMSLLELMVALGVFGVLALVATSLTTQVIGVERGSRVRDAAETGLLQAQALFLKRMEMRSGLDTQLRPGNQGTHAETALGIKRLTPKGESLVRFSTTCRQPTPAQQRRMMRLPAGERRKAFLLPAACDRGGPVCAPGQLPILSIEHKASETKQREKPGIFQLPAKGAGADALSGAFCLTRSSTLAYRVIFQQAFVDGERVVVINRELAIPSSEALPYSADGGAGITYLTTH